MTSLSTYDATSMSEPTDAATLIQGTFERCCQAFCRYFTVRSGGDTHLVDDLMQELWLQARLKADDLRGANPEPWLWRIAQNLLREHWRKRGGSLAARVKADPALARSLAARLDTEEIPAETLARKDVQEQLLLALTELPAETQELLIEFYFEGRAHAELATALNISERAVEGRLYRARAALGDKLAHLERQEDL